MININFEERIDKLNILLNMWSQRNLTIKGKITILKTKAIPLILYPSTFLYVPKHIITTVDKIMYNFVWKNKHHVKKTTLIAKPVHGGLKMPDIDTVIRANKLNFIKRILNLESNSNKTASCILRTRDLENFLKNKKQHCIPSSSSKFYEQLLDIWYDIHNSEPVQVDDILQEHIWFNARILIGNKPAYNKTWCDAGIETIQDILDGNSILSKERLEEKYNISCDFLFYNGVRSAIPNKWLEKIHKTSSANIRVSEAKHPLSIMLRKKDIDIRLATCRQLYWVEIDKVTERPTCYYKWESEFYYANFDWSLINLIPYECTTETYLQSLQFKIIHRYFLCNYKLHLWAILDNNKCAYCNAIDTLTHYFVECESVRIFWKSLKAWFLRNFQFVINCTALDVLLQIPNYERSNDITNLNFVILFAKNYIYTCKKNGMQIDFDNFLEQLKTHMVIEEFRCSMYNKSLEFYEKWSILADSL